ncbi:hypothetical protein OUZ56_025072 [Daphnia magna]|uniref:Uncharacterized protein n=1 Tax=Daphnia magna TaxID=35525 RepID=A0ABQ9ZIR6_9CRUS|nr:hypothetical protein OUZ56_025072 [Daphnia magna]
MEVLAILELKKQSITVATGESQVLYWADGFRILTDRSTTTSDNRPILDLLHGILTVIRIHSCDYNSSNGKMRLTRGARSSTYTLTGTRGNSRYNLLSDCEYKLTIKDYWLCRWPEMDI